mmetsp:Transcript_4024/g.12898  ORF Transcript_4024/g.12898 Transcript_4024/m.12898 type:complete len:210 (-) Transcript_4024:26-655(-)
MHERGIPRSARSPAGAEDGRDEIHPLRRSLARALQTVCRRARPACYPLMDNSEHLDAPPPQARRLGKALDDQRLELHAIRLPMVEHHQHSLLLAPWSHAAGHQLGPQLHDQDPCWTRRETRDGGTRVEVRHGLVTKMERVRATGTDGRHATCGVGSRPEGSIARSSGRRWIRSPAMHRKHTASRSRVACLNQKASLQVTARSWCGDFTR